MQHRRWTPTTSSRSGHPRIWRVVACTGLIGVLSACGTLSNGRRWGQDATLRPGWERVRAAAVHALSSPGTWVPAAGAALFQIGEADRHLAHWASDHTPVFGSQSSADRATSQMNHAMKLVLAGTVLATPDGEDTGPWLTSKLSGAGVDYAALSLTGATTSFLKTWAHRTRPNGENNRSLPSSNASDVAVAATLAYGNIAQLDISEGAKSASAVGLTAVSVLSGWGRLEAGAHFPSDVLVGMALGHALGLFVQDAFMGIGADRLSLQAAPLDGGFAFGASWRF